MKKFRLIHRKAAPIIFLPLLVTAVTGVGYRIGRSWFGASETFGDWLMTFHEGRYLGQPLVPVYILLVGLGMLGMLVTGVFMAQSQLKKTASAQAKPPKRNSRWVHGILAPLAALPLLATVLTGMGYRLGRAWFDISDEQAKLLMTIHQGSWLGSTVRPFYVLLVGMSLLALLITGWQMTGIFRDRSAKKAS